MKHLTLFFLLVSQLTFAVEQTPAKDEVVQISAGNTHSCALYKSGRAVCWGDNFYGQLGFGYRSRTYRNGEKPNFVQIDEKIIQIEAGGFSTCALLKGGRAKCWGLNSANQLGFFSFKDVFFDMKRLPYVEIGEKIKKLVVGYDTACAILINGKVKCWGSNFLKLLGVGNILQWYNPLAQSIFYPQQVLLDENILSLSFGIAHTCALLESKQAKCWGSNDLGGLGNGRPERVGANAEEMRSLTPVMVDEKIIELTAYCALFESGRAKCWGRNDLGQLGIASKEMEFNTADQMRKLPYVQVDEKIKHIISDGGGRACAILESDKLRCWGDNRFGAIGVGRVQNFVGFELSDLRLPLAAVGDEPVKQVALGPRHTCALLVSGQVRCWGENERQQLGTGDNLNRGTIDYGDNPFPDVRLP